MEKKLYTGVKEKGPIGEFEIQNTLEFADVGRWKANGTSGNTKTKDCIDCGEGQNAVS
jgi:hypothetical protein